MQRKLNFGFLAGLGILGATLSCLQLRLDMPDAVSGASQRSDGAAPSDAPVGGPGTSISAGSGGSGPPGGSGGGGGAGGSGGTTSPATTPDPVCNAGSHVCHGTCVDGKSPMT